MWMIISIICALILWGTYKLWGLTGLLVLLAILTVIHIAYRIRNGYWLNH